MTIFQIPVSSAIAGLLTFAFTGAGLFNAIGGAAVQAKFVRWGYPVWWNFVTAAVEILCAALVAVAQTRVWGLAIGALVLIAAIATLVWRRDYKELAPGMAFTALIAIELTLVVVH